MVKVEMSTVKVQGGQPCWVESESGGGPQLWQSPMLTGDSPSSGPAVYIHVGVKGHIDQGVASNIRPAVHVQ